ncbi:hypothetical protein M0813_29865 [Anaeramoeba flamelloides]|uniref:Uncharacterized protein n=1 Tax=Anaeramoeba flamelloides TaxID=1746091 RepID=A0ABQ8XLP5_9EUKA|nr:hypothetical protein M0813_29865 [Anaeramoeba flamelloides]
MGNTEHTPNVCEEKNELYQKLFKSNKACAVFNNYEQIVFFTKRFLKNIGWSGSGFVIKNQTIDFFSTQYNQNIINAFNRIKRQLGRVDDDELKIDINLNLEKIQKILEHYQKKKQKSFSSCVKHMRESQKCYQKKYQRLQSHHNSRLIEIDNNKELKLKLIRENKLMRQRISQTFQFLLSQKNGIKNILSQVETKNFSDLSNQNDYY